MLRARCLNIGLHMSRSLLMKPAFKVSTTVTHLETVSSFMRVNPLSNNLTLQNLSELLQARGRMEEMELSEVPSISDLISIIIRGTLNITRNH